MGDKVSVTVIATGFDRKNEEEQPAAEEELVAETASEEKEEDDDVVDLDTFVNIMNPSKGFKQAEFEGIGEFVAPKQAASASQAANPAPAKPASNGNAPKKTSLGSDMTRSPNGIRPPAGFKDDGNLQMPACWRKLEDLPRTISFK